MSVDAGTFKKQPLVPGGASGIIYGDDSSINANKANLDGIPLTDPMDGAVFVLDGPKTRETTVMPDQHLDSAVADSWVE